MRAEPGNLNVVVQQIRPDRNFVVLAGKKLLLIIEARSPGEVATDLQVFAQAMPQHVRRVDAFGRLGVMRAAGCVNVVVAGPPAEL